MKYINFFRENKFCPYDQSKGKTCDVENNDGSVISLDNSINSTS